MTSLFPRSIAGDFAPLFRLMDTTDPFIQPQASLRPFTPRFDVREIGSTYELHGELPGIKQGDIDIEFVDANTLVIRGRSERETTQTSEDSTAASGTTSSQPVADDNTSEKSSSSYQKASVEDDYVDASAVDENSEPTTEREKSAIATPSSTQATVTKTAEPSYKYWVSERSVGHFERRFTFPGKVDQDAVKASLKEGILSVIVHKAVRAEKKITIE